MRTSGVKWQDCGLRGRLLWAPLRVRGQRSSIVGFGTPSKKGTRVGRRTSIQGPWSDPLMQADQRAVMAAAVAAVMGEGLNHGVGVLGENQNKGVDTSTSRDQLADKSNSRVLLGLEEEQKVDRARVKKDMFLFLVVF